MADLSAVLRKTIDGLPNASPELRAKVYDKARAAIERQIAAANPPLAEELIEARRSALADAIDRTEDHYLGQEDAPVPAPAPVAPKPPAPPAIEPRAATPAPPPRAPVTSPSAPSAPSAPLPHVDRGPRPSAGVQKPAWPTATSSGSELAIRADPRRDPVRGEPDAPRVPDAARSGLDAPRTEVRTNRPPERREPSAEGMMPSPGARPSGASGLDTSAIPVADVAAPRYANGRRPSQKTRSRSPALAGIAVVIGLGGAAALAYVYKDQLEAMLVGPNTADTTATATATPSAGTSASTPATVDGGDVAALAPPSATGTGTGTAAPKRRFTQRLMPDGTEVDEGPGAGTGADFGEGTNIAAASPDVTPAPLVPPVATTPEATTPEDTATEGTDPEVTDPEAEADVPPAAAEATPAPTTESAALTPGDAAVPAVAQKAVFYEERTETEQGSQRGGNVVWSVVEEAPSDGAPPEPAIRAVADVPEENLRLTMTIRRNTDDTLPASHVIEMMFDVPANFAGGQIANVQRLALKPTEEARGEPLIGVAGKISDGFFIVALNNLAQATQTNLGLLGKEQWIDIPLAYSSGRRALISIEKGIPGDRVFKQAMDAWAAKT